MFENGKIPSPFMVAPLSHEDMPEATAVITANVQVRNWFQGQTR